MLFQSVELVCCSVVQCVAVRQNVLQCVTESVYMTKLQCVAVCCSALQFVLQFVAVCCSVLQRAAVCCSAL